MDLLWLLLCGQLGPVPAPNWALKTPAWLPQVSDVFLGRASRGISLLILLHPALFPVSSSAAELAEMVEVDPRLC